MAVANLDTHRVVGYDVHTSEPVMSVDAPVTPDEELTLTHSVFGPDANGHTICLINSSKRKKPDGGVKLGVAVIVPIKSEFNVKSLQAVAVGYPSFDVLTENKTIEKVVAQFVSRISVSQSPSGAPGAP